MNDESDVLKHGCTRLQKIFFGKLPSLENSTGMYLCDSLVSADTVINYEHEDEKNIIFHGEVKADEKPIRRKSIFSTFGDFSSTNIFVN